MSARTNLTAVNVPHDSTTNGPDRVPGLQAHRCGRIPPQRMIPNTLRNLLPVALARQGQKRCHPGKKGRGSRCGPRARQHRLLLCLGVFIVAGGPARAAPITAASAGAGAATWQTCTALPDAARLACFDAWAHAQATGAAGSAQPALQVAPRAGTETPGPDAVATSAAATLPGPTTVLAVGKEQGCRNRKYSEISRFWELEAGSSCPTFGLRAYRPNILAVAHGTRINREPQSGNPMNSATHATGYSRNEARVVLSIRTKLASGLLAARAGGARDSLWLAYTQQSYWQIFNGAISRPFRNTDYQPELIYVYPTTVRLPGGWQWRYAGAGLVHQSNGQSDPLSRSWNRAYLMAGLEKDDRFNLQVRVWQRFHESAAKDNNPGIVKRIGRGDVTLGWNVGDRDTLRATYTGAFNKYGSGRLEWSHALGSGHGNTTSGLRFYTGLFHGYGDSLIDYNFRRTVLSVGLSLVDF